MLHIAAQVLREVMQRRTRRARGGHAALQAEAIQRRDLEVLAHGEDRRLRREDPVVVADEDARRPLQQRAERPCFTGVNRFRRAQTLQFGEQFGIALGFRRAEVAGGQIHDRDARRLADGINGGEEIIPLRREQAFVEVRAGRKDLRDLAFDELAGARLLHLIAHGDLAARAEDARDVAVERVVRDAAHRHRAALGERDVEELRAGDRVLEKHLVEITEAEEQQRVLGQLAFDAAILRHHRRELRFRSGGGHRGRDDSGKKISREVKLCRDATGTNPLIHWPSANVHNVFKKLSELIPTRARAR